MINRNFILLWLGKIVSQLGDKFYGIALAWWILKETNSPSIMGFFLFVSVLPGILMGFFAGALTDRWNRKRILVVTDVLRGILVLSISYLSMINSLQVYHVFIIGLGLSLVSSFFDPAMQAVIPEVVDKDNLPKANGMSQMVSGICTVAGPMLGAVTVSLFGLTSVFLANSISYFISAFFTCFIALRRTYKTPIQKGSIYKDIKEGISFIKGQKQITLILKVIALAHAFVGSLTVILPFLANSLHGNGVKNLGYLEAMLGVGLIIGSIFIGARKKISINEKTMLYYIMAMGICFISISVLSNLKIETPYLYMIIMAVVGICVSGASVFWQSLLQRYTPSNMTGRVFSVSTLVGNLSLPLAYGIFGVLMDSFAIATLMIACGTSLVLLCGIFLYRAF